MQAKQVEGYIRCFRDERLSQISTHVNFLVKTFTLTPKLQRLCQGTASLFPNGQYWGVNCLLLTYYLFTQAEVTS